MSDSDQGGNSPEASDGLEQDLAFLSLAQPALQSPLQTLSTLGNEICHECRGVDLQKIMSINMFLPQRYQYGLLVEDVGDRFKKMPENDCPLCQMLFACRLKPQNATEAEIGDEIRAFSFVDWFEGIDTSIYHMPDAGVSLCVVPRSLGFGQPRERMARHFREFGHVFCHEYPQYDYAAVFPRLVRRDFDATLVRTWFEFCQQHHKLCAPRSNPVSGLRLIDCTTCTVVDAPPDLQYVALSYVWGQVAVAQMEAGSSKIPVSKLPPSISDAIQATAALDFDTYGLINTASTKAIPRPSMSRSSRWTRSMATPSLPL